MKKLQRPHATKAAMISPAATGIACAGLTGDEEDDERDLERRRRDRRLDCRDLPFDRCVGEFSADVFGSDEESFIERF